VGMVRRRSIRDVPPLPDGAVLVRALFEVYDHGGDYDRDVLIADATYNFDEFGYYGLSLWLVSEAWTLDRLRAEKTRKAARVALYTAGDLTEHGLKLVASGREPHYDATDGALIEGDSGSVRITAGSAEELTDRFLGTPYTVEQNPRFVQDVR
jgi:hypothetical protein